MNLFGLKILIACLNSLLEVLPCEENLALRRQIGKSKKHYIRTRECAKAYDGMKDRTHTRTHARSPARAINDVIR